MGYTQVWRSARHPRPCLYDPRRPQFAVLYLIENLRKAYGGHVVACRSQRPLTLFDLTVCEALAYKGRVHSISAGDAGAQTSGIVEQLGLGPAAVLVVAKLSGGRHRLMTPGTALIGDAETLVLDEPTNTLEPKMRRRVWTA